MKAVNVFRSSITSLLVASALFFVTFTTQRGMAGNYLLSSETIVQEKQGPLKDLRSFVFFPLIKLEDNQKQKIAKFFDQSLKRVGTVLEKQTLTPKGADLEVFSNPSLQFTLEQLVDQEGRLLPVLKATLSSSGVVEVLSSKESSSLSLNHWCTYLEKNDNVEKVVKKAFPFLLDLFIADWQAANGKEQKPTFYITYDASLRPT
jgi:hypothetical protein